MKAQALQWLWQDISSTIADSLQHWVNQYPQLQWAIAHPIWFAALIVIAIWLLLGLFGAIARSSEQIWLAIVRFPFWLVQVLFKLAVKYLPGMVRTAKEGDRKTRDQRLSDILSRLEAMRQEQDQLLQEVKELLREE